MIALKLGVAVLLFVILVPVVLRVLAMLGLRFAARTFLSAIGQNAMKRLPDELGLEPAPGAVFLDAAGMESLLSPLRQAGFVDLDTFTSPKMAGMKMRVLLKEDDGVAAYVYEHPRGGQWIEMSTRYEDGSTTAISNMKPTGISQRPPFFRRTEVPPGTPGDQMYSRHMQVRSTDGIRRVTAANVIEEYELAYAKITAWQKNRGLTPEEVAAVGKQWLERRRAAAAGRNGA